MDADTLKSAIIGSSGMGIQFMGTLPEGDGPIATENSGTPFD